MRRLLVIFVAASLILAPYTASVNAMSLSSGLPPVEQPLVSEGEFAVELAAALNLPSSHQEAAAERSLALNNISPKNGWISDYPMTPDILAEVRESAARSASAGSLNMPEAEAVRAVERVSIAMGLPVKVAGSGSQYQSSSAALPYAADVEEYYNDNGPPVVTYYPPPSDYADLYDWVPWPFWWGGFAFGGFFILIDFDRHHHHHRFTNRVTTANGTVTRVNPVTRATAMTSPGSSNLGMSSQATQAGGRSMVGRDLDRSPSFGGAPSVRSFSSGWSGFHGGGMGGFHGGGHH